MQNIVATPHIGQENSETFFGGLLYVYKALAMGASAVGIGRPYCWGLGAFGQSGVERVLDLLNRELRITMVGSGTPTVASIGPDYVLDAGHRVPRGRLGRELL